MQCGLVGTHNLSPFAQIDMAVDVPTKANSRTTILLKSETRTAVLCKKAKKAKKSKTKQKLKCLLVAWHFPPAMGG